MKGFEALPELIGRSGVPVVFSMLAGPNIPWIGQGVREGALRLVKTRHEGAAVTAAAAYGRVSGTVGIASVTRGPGFANAVNSLIAASSSHCPLLLLVAESPASKETSAKNIDQRGLSQLMGLGFHHAAGPEQLETAFWSGLRSAHFDGRAQVVSIGDGILDAEVPLRYEPGVSPARRRESPWPMTLRPGDDAIAATVDALLEARRPLVLAGQGAVLADCRDDLESLAELVGARLATTLYANRFFAGSPRNLGLCGGWAPPLARRCLEETDAVLAVGASMNAYTTAGGAIFRDAVVIHCDIADGGLGIASSPELALRGDAGSTARALVEECERRGLTARGTGAETPPEAEIRDSVHAIDLGHDPSRGLDLRRAYTILDGRLPEDRIVVSDSGRHLTPLISLVGSADARSWVVSRGYGSVGLGLGAAIGAASAGTGRPVVLFCGDGGLMMAAQELDTVRIHGLAVTIVVLNDEMYGSEVKHLRKYGLAADVAQQSLPDIPTLAAAFGGRGEVVRTEEELGRVELGGEGLLILDVRLDPQVDGQAAAGRLLG